MAFLASSEFFIMQVFLKGELLQSKYLMGITSPDVFFIVLIAPHLKLDLFYKAIPIAWIWENSVALCKIRGIRELENS